MSTRFLWGEGGVPNMCWDRTLSKITANSRLIRCADFSMMKNDFCSGGGIFLLKSLKKRSAVSFAMATGCFLCVVLFVFLGHMSFQDKLNHYDLGQKIVYQCGKRFGIRYDQSPSNKTALYRPTPPNEKRTSLRRGVKWSKTCMDRPSFRQSRKGAAGRAA